MCAHLVETILVQKLQIAFSQQPQDTVYSHILDILDISDILDIWRYILTALDSDGWQIKFHPQMG